MKRVIKEKVKKSLIIKSAGICGLSNNRCVDEGINTGEFCHFSGVMPNGPRYDSNLLDKNSEYNLGFFHSPKNKVIDEQEEKYPTELLKKIKKEHEEKIAERQKNFKDNHIKFWDK
ncbi:MAG: hypothetical protein ACRCZ2_00690 [Fusobacteriaceae bacterium]